MRAAWAIARRDIRSFFGSPMAYIVLVVWVYWTAATFYVLARVYATQPGLGTDNVLSAFFGQTALFFIPMLVFVPVLTMRLLAAERATGTLEPLMTAPVGSGSIVAGKYLAGLTFWIALWVPTLLFVWIASRYGELDLRVVASSYLGIFGIGVFYIALGLLMSALASTQIIAAVLTFMALGLLFLLGIGQFAVDDTGIKEVLGCVSVWSHMGDFSKGIVDSRYLVFDLTVAALALFGAVRVLEWQRGRA